MKTTLTPLKRRPVKSTKTVAATKPKKKAFLITDRPVKNTMKARVEKGLVLNDPSAAPRRSATSL